MIFKRKKFYLLISVLFLIFSYFSLSLYFTKRNYVTYSLKTNIENNIVLNDLKNAPNFTSGSSLLVNQDSGQILFEQDLNKEIPVYSVSKLVSAYIVFDELKKNSFSLDSKIVASKEISEVSKDFKFSGSPIDENQSYSVAELLDALFTESNNAATMMLAKKISGSEEDFVVLMNQKLEKLNMKNSKMFTSSGLDKTDLLPYGYVNLKEGANYMSANDAAILAFNLLKDYPETLSYSSKTSAFLGIDSSNPLKISSTNNLLDGQKDALGGVSGLKTGSSLDYFSVNMITTFKKNNINYISVRLGSYDHEVRTKEIRSIYDFSNVFKNIKISNSLVVNDENKINIKHGKSDSIEVYIDELSLLSNDFKLNYYFIPNDEFYDVDSNSFLAPLKKGDVVGKFVLAYDDLNFLDGNKEINVYANEDVKKHSWLYNLLSDFFN